MKRFLLIICLISTGIYAQTDNFNWVNIVQPNSYDASNYTKNKSFATDSNGNVYSSGLFTGDINFIFQSGNQSLNDNSTTYYLKKEDTNGNLEWIKKVPFIGRILVDSNDDLIITGVFSNTIDFNPGTSTNILSSIGSTDTYILKLNSSGDFQWVKQLESDDSSSYSRPILSKLDNNDNILITGDFSGNVDFDPDTSTTNLMNANAIEKRFLLKLDPNGDFQWLNFLGYYAHTSFGIDSNRNIICTVRCSPGIVNFTLGGNTYSYTNTQNTHYILKIDPQGDPIWIEKIEGDTDVGSYIVHSRVTTDNANNIYLGGEFRYKVDFDPSSSTEILTSTSLYDLFILKLDSNGNFQWVKQLGNDQYESLDQIIASSDGNLYIKGQFSDQMDFDPGNNVHTLTTSGNPLYAHTPFFLKLDLDGNFIQVDKLENTFYTFIDVNSDNLYIHGQFMNTVDFDFSSSTHEVSAISTTEFTETGDTFLLKLGNGSLHVDGFQKNTTFIYPNPTTGQFRITLPETNIIDAIEIYDTQGKKVRHFNASKNESAYNIKTLMSGVYFVKIYHQKGIDTHKLILE